MSKFGESKHVLNSVCTSTPFSAITNCIGASKFPTDNKIGYIKNHQKELLKVGQLYYSIPVAAGVIHESKSNESCNFSTMRNIELCRAQWQ